MERTERNEIMTEKTTSSPAEPKSSLIRLQGPGQELHLVGTKTKTGWKTSVQLRKVEGRKTVLISRGASADHTTYAQARKALDAHAVQAAKDGWKRVASRAGGFAAKPDAFTVKALPQPAR
jgi:hypothetical protein